jgi:hypothetical protein
MQITDIHGEPHSNPPADPGLKPNYGNIGIPLEMTTSRDSYNNENKNFQEDTNTNQAPQPNLLQTTGSRPRAILLCNIHLFL